MLEQIARHGGLDLEVSCRGDVEVDAHHTVEDTALVLGQALRQALGNKCGIERFGCTVPRDEAATQVALDLSGRPHLVFDATFRDARVGELPTEMVEHFYRSLSQALGATLHMSVTGANTHHMVESSFKAFGRALRQAAARTGDELPSTKGVL
jgi:imidazoleglycerol-phosphate dehydratase/histidinol-phosphatase